MADKIINQDSILTYTSSTFQQQYQANAVFIQNLRKQSSKIEQMLAYIERLKSDCEHKDKLIYELKRRQTQAKLDKVKIEEYVAEEYLGKLKLAQLRIDQLQAFIMDLQNELFVIKSQPDRGYQLKNMQSVYFEETQRLRLEKEELRKQNQKLQDKYKNCKQQCSLLRCELQDEKRGTKELQMLLKSNRNKQNLNIQQVQLKHRKLQQGIRLLKQEKNRLQFQNVKLEQYLNSMERELFNQMEQYEGQIKQMIKEVARIQDNQAIWKQRYCELQIMVNHVETLRNNWRLNKMYSFNNKSNLESTSAYRDLEHLDQINQISREEIQESIQRSAIRRIKQQSILV